MPVLSVPFYKTQFYKNTLAPLNANSQNTYASQTLSLSAIPNRIYIWFSKTKNSLTITDTDTMANIKNISMNFGASNGLLSTYSEADLYNRLGVENGYAYSAQQFNTKGTLNGSGTCLCVQIGKDIQIADICPGELLKVNISYSCLIENSTPNQMIYDANCLIVYEGCVQFLSSGGNGLGTRQVTSTLSAITEADASIYLNQDAEGVYSSGSRLFGSGWWDNVKNAFNNYVKPVASAVRGVVDSGLVSSLAPGKVGQLANNLRNVSDKFHYHGYGLDEGMTAGMTAGKRYKKVHYK
jgi:hypothetical protein